MATMRKYFRYRFHLECRVPKRKKKMDKQLKIKNCEKLFLTKLKKLREYQSNKWCELLKDTMNFLMSGDDEGDVGLDYWQKSCDFKEGNGGNSSGYLYGWMTVFYAFSKKGNWKVRELENTLRIGIWRICHLEL